MLKKVSNGLHLKDGETISLCSQYIYLGTKIEGKGNTDKEIEERMIKEKQPIGALNSLLWSK